MKMHGNHLVSGILGLLIGFILAVGYISATDNHNDKIEFLTACSNLEKVELNRDQCLVMWYTRGITY